MSKLKTDANGLSVNKESTFYEHRKVQGWEGELHFITSGDKEAQPVVFLHGITEFAESFLPVIELLPSSLYAISIDLRGRGKSFKPEKGYRLHNYIEDLLVIWNMFSGDSKRPILVGHSMSGRIATAFAAQYPQLVSGLVLIDPPISGPGRRLFPVPLTRFTSPKQALEKADMEMFSAYYDPTKVDIELKKKELQACSLHAIEQTYRSFNQEPFHVYYQMITTPTLLLAAECSPLITDVEYSELQQMNPHVQMKRVPNIGHEIYKEDPQLFTNELVTFIQTLTLS